MISFLHSLVSALIVLLYILNSLTNCLERQEIQSAGIRPGIQEYAPEQAIRMIADEDKVETVPVFLDFPDEVPISRELGRKALRGRYGNFLAP